MAERLDGWTDGRSNARARLVVAIDDPATRDNACSVLTEAGHRVHPADSASVPAALARHRPHVLVVDIAALGPDGRGTWTRRRDRRSVPALVVTTYKPGEDDDRAFRGGGDDYVVVPCRPAELRHRVAALLARFGTAKPVNSTEAPTAELTVDPIRPIAYRQQQTVPLSPREWRTLRVLLSQPGQAWSTEDLASVAELNVDSTLPPNETVRVVVRRLRVKLERDAGHPRYLRTLHGFGYLIDPHPVGADS